MVNSRTKAWEVPGWLKRRQELEAKRRAKVEEFQPGGFIEVVSYGDYAMGSVDEKIIATTKSKVAAIEKVMREAAVSAAGSMTIISTPRRSGKSAWLRGMLADWVVDELAPPDKIYAFNDGKPAAVIEVEAIQTVSADVGSW